MADVNLAPLQQSLRLLEEDQKERVFFMHPYLLGVKKVASKEWLTDIAERLSEAKYTPSATVLIDVPKPDWHVRPGQILSIDDELVYHFLALNISKVTWAELQWSEKNSIRHSHFLRHSQDSGQWFREPFGGWRRFRDKTNELIKDEHFSYVVFADISGYYENINLAILARYLRELGTAENDLKTLSACLNKWADSRQRGIPQGYSPSDIWGELYLSPIDRHLESEGIRHLRYMDDYRLFAKTEVAARRALVRLEALLRERGLNLQTAKSRIITAQSALVSVNSVSEIVNQINEELFREATETDDEYMRARFLSAGLPLVDAAKPSVEILGRAWSNFENGRLTQKFDKTIFHFLLKRLGEQKMVNAVDYCVRELARRPEETRHILEYVSNVCDHEDGSFERIAASMRCDDIIFDYQKYQVFRWYFERRQRSEALLSAAREIVRSTRRDHMLRPYAVAYLGTFADGTDFDLLGNEYRASVSDAEKVAAICAMATAPNDRRGSFFSRCSGESALITQAVQHAKSTNSARDKNRR